MSVTTILVTATYQRPDGEPPQGKVTFTPATYYVDTEDGLIIPPIPQEVRLDADGHIEVYLPISDDPDVNPTNFSWTIREDLHSPNFRRSRTYNVQLQSESLPEVDLSELVPIGSDNGDLTAVTQSYLEEQLLDYETIADHDADLALYETTAAHNSSQAAALASYETSAAHTADLANYRTRTFQNSRENVLDTGFGTFDRRLMGSLLAHTTSGRMFLTYFTPPKDYTITSVRMYSNNTTPSGLSVTLFRIGIYTIAGNGDLTLVASTPNDTTLFTAANTTYTKALSATYAVTAGTRYAVGHVPVFTGTMPGTFGNNGGGSQGVAVLVEPKIAGQVSSLSDLPSSISNASISAPGVHPYVEFI